MPQLDIFLTPSKLSRARNELHSDESLANVTSWKLRNSWLLPRPLLAFHKLMVRSHAEDNIYGFH